MASRVIGMIRDALGLGPSEPPRMNDEQVIVAERLRRIEQRQRAIDIQIEVLQADRRDDKRRR